MCDEYVPISPKVLAFIVPIESVSTCTPLTQFVTPLRFVELVDWIESLLEANCGLFLAFVLSGMSFQSCFGKVKSVMSGMSVRFRFRCLIGSCPCLNFKSAVWSVWLSVCIYCRQYSHEPLLMAHCTWWR